jgi:hypothetical protein
VLVSFVALSLHLHFSPFREAINNQLQMGSLTVTCISQFGALCLRLEVNKEGSDAMAALVLALSMCVPLVMFPVSILAERKAKAQLERQVRHLTLGGNESGGNDPKQNPWPATSAEAKKDGSGKAAAGAGTGQELEMIDLSGGVL